MDEIDKSGVAVNGFDDGDGDGDGDDERTMDRAIQIHTRRVRMHVPRTGTTHSFRGKKIFSHNILACKYTDTHTHNFCAHFNSSSLHHQSQGERWNKRKFARIYTYIPRYGLWIVFARHNSLSLSHAMPTG